MNSFRVSLNSVQQQFYHAYYHPRDYVFQDVVASVDAALTQGVHVALNYLVMPGFTDSFQEHQALMNFLSSRRIDMIQWRNLNFDPLEYFRVISYDPDPSGILGVDRALRQIHKNFPHIMKGYFNPSRGAYPPACAARRRRQDLMVRGLAYWCGLLDGNRI
jgi:hypothetical protein